MNGHYGPTLLEEAEALSVASVATVEGLSFDGATKAPEPSIKA
ncbi:hypothetical protein [Mesorhizobium sp. WSM4313]|nr:hypothetical protein [Mesorhizobium sp. WSM4313]